MDLKPRKGNVIVGILAFVIVYLLYIVSENYISGGLIPVNKPINPTIAIVISLVIGVIAYIIASTCCCCCKTKGKKKDAKNKGAK